MAAIEKKDVNPIVVLLLNLFLLGGVGYYIAGQSNKGTKAIIMYVILWVIGIVTCGALSFLPMIYCILTAIDGMQVAKALEAGEEVDEEEYKFEFAFKVSKFLHKEAIFNG